MKRIALIPSYEPDVNLNAVVNESVKNGFSVVVVNDGSSKDKLHFFEELPKENVALISHEKNQGKGAALKTGMKFIKENFEPPFVVVTIDSDGQHRIEDALKITDIAIKNPDSLVLGCRKLNKDSPKKSRAGNFVAKTSFLFFTKNKVNDTQTGLRAFTDKIIDSIMLSRGNRYEYEMNMLLDCTRKGIKIIEETIKTIYLNDNVQSHYNPLKDSFRIVKEVVKFSASSIIGFLVDYSLYSLLLFVCPITFDERLIFANVCARIVSASINFTINYLYVFKSKQKPIKAAIKYLALAIFILAVNTTVLWLLVNKAGFNEQLAKIIVEVTLFIVSWIVQRLFVFRKKKVNK